jgi:hypothetical protein
VEQPIEAASGERVERRLAAVDPAGSSAASGIGAASAAASADRQHS